MYNFYYNLCSIITTVCFKKFTFFKLYLIINKKNIKIRFQAQFLELNPLLKAPTLRACTINCCISHSANALSHNCFFCCDGDVDVCSAKRKRQNKKGNSQKNTLGFNQNIQNKYG